MFDTENYLCDTHTAVAINVYGQYLKETGDNKTPTIIASTASPYKFAASVLDALVGEHGGDEFSQVSELAAVSGTPVPAPLAELQNKPVRFQNVCAPEEMRRFVLNTLGL